MHRFLAIFERDLRKFIRNPIVVAMSLLMPIIYLVILGNSFQGELRHLPIAVVDMDNGPYSARVSALLAQSRQALHSGGQPHLRPGLRNEALREGLFRPSSCHP